MSHWMRQRVSKTTVFALVGGIGLLAAALVLAQAPIMALLSPESILMVFGGTIAATVISYKRSTLTHAWKSIRQAFLEDHLTPESALDYAIDVARFIREQGNLALQPMLNSIELPILRKGLSMILDNCPENFIQSSLTTEIEVTYRQQTDAARVLETAGGYAPTMGIIGAVIGLMHVVQSLSNPAELGSGVASAFCSTLFGVAFANLFLLPMAAKLRQQARDDGFINTMLTEAVMSIARREHPLVMEEKLCAYVGKDPMIAHKGNRYSSTPAKSSVDMPISSAQVLASAKAVDIPEEYNFLDDAFHQMLRR